MPCVWRWKHDQLDVAPVAGDVGLEAAADEQSERVDRGVERGARRRGLGARQPLGRKDVDAFCAELDRVANRRVVHHTTIDEPLLADRHGGEDPGNRAGCEDCIDRTSVAEDRLGAGGDVEGDETERNGRVREVDELNVTFDDLAQAARRNEMVALPSEAADDGPQTEREGIGAFYPAPDSCELPRRLRGLWPRCYEGSVEGANRRRYQHVCRDPTLIERPKHAHLKRAEARAARED